MTVAPYTSLNPTATLAKATITSKVMKIAAMTAYSNPRLSSFARRLKVEVSTFTCPMGVSLSSLAAKTIERSAILIRAANQNGNESCYRSRRNAGATA